MSEAFICDAIRTPIGAFGGSLSTIRTDDLASIPLKALKERNTGIDWDQLDDLLSLIHISSPRDLSTSRMPSSA